MNVKAMDYLLQNKYQNIPAVGALSRGAEVVLQDDKGVILYERAIGVYYVSVDDNALLETDWWDEREKAEVLALREQNIEAVARRIHAKVVRPCKQVVFLSKAPSCPEIEGFRIAPLTLSDTDFVCEHYAMMLDRGYMEQRLKSGNVFGAYYHDALAGFAGRHSDGSVGMLEILPQYRRLGIGSALGCFIINRVLEKGETPYAHIFPDNAASLAMTSRIEGAVFLDELVAWLA